MTSVLSAKRSLLFFLSILLFNCQGYAQGTWTAFTNLAPHFNSGVMLLLPDGKIMCKTSSGTGYGKVWDILTPDANGSYKNGTWASTDTMHDDRLYFSSQVLNDGRVYVAGGEYGSGLTKGEVYDPLTNVWTMCPVAGLNISDANSAMLPSGKILQAAVASDLKHTYLYNPATNTYAAGPSSFGIHNESAWVTLPDSSVLFVDRLSTNSERYIPSTNSWVHDATVPVGLYDPYGDETGAGFLLPNGKVFFIGSTGTTAIYTPSGTTSPGTWAAGATVPGSQGAPDAAAAMMVNGNILCAVSPVPSSGDHFPDSTYFYEYDYTTDAFTAVNTPFGGTLVSGWQCFTTNMLCLPDGNILFCFQGYRRYYIYTPGSGALAAGKPTVSNVFRTNCDTFTATGTLFNGITEGASYGDDWQMASNYPVIRLTSGSNVYYTRTYAWNRIGAVMTGAAPDTVKFVLPTGLAAGTYSLQVVANGNPSSNYSLNTNITVSPSTTTICPVSTATVTASWTGGTWSSSNTGVATIGSSTGVITGVAAGTATITYTLSAGCTALATVNVNSGAAAISGPSVVCTNATITLTDATSGGTWSSSNTGVATVGSGSGIVSGVSPGTATISYTVGACTPATTTTITVNPLPAAITGTTNVCVGSTTTLSDGGGGTWSSNNTALATVGSGSGIVTGVSSGTPVITYTLPVTGCFITTPVTVNPLPSAISGVTGICAGATTTLTDGGGGTWSSSNNAVATVGSTTGVVTGVALGTSTIVYTLSTGCTATTNVTVNPPPSPIGGPDNVCAGSTITLTDAGGGSWSSSNTSAATIGSISGIVSGVSPGTTTITYSLGAGCIANAVITVNSIPGTISGTANVCVGATTTLTDGGGGTWGSSNTAQATVGSGTGIVTGVSTGTPNITYTLSTGCFRTIPVTVNPLPSSISGVTSVCVNATTTLSDGGGGTWSSSNTAQATVVINTGVVTGVSAGTPTITYTLPTGCTTTTLVTVNPLPAAITGTMNVCVGSTTTLSDGGGGTWSSNNTALATVGSGSGIVTGVSSGVPVITYTLPATNCFITTPVTVNPLPSAISGVTGVCVGATTTLTDAGGGTWSSSDIAVATVGSTTGVVTGVALGTSTIVYTLATGCVATKNVTVNPPPSAIGGPDNVCAGATMTLTDAGGGSWSSSNTSAATIGSISGIVSGVSPGTTTITYSLGAGCIANMVVTVNSIPGTISGTTNVCVGATTTLTDGGGGTWGSSNTAQATVGSGTGIVTGVSSGTPDITYTLSTGCFRTIPVTVNPLPSSISGVTSVCVNATTTLSDGGGGTWSSSNTAQATVVINTGVVTGVSAGTPTITYTLPTGCNTTTLVTVNPLPAAITGTKNVCVGSVTTLSDGGGGTWSSSNTALATVVSGSGDVTGVSSGVPVITYTLPVTNCFITTPVTVNPLPSAISGTAGVCAGGTTTLTDAGGGTWSSSDNAVATAGTTTGVITGVSLGTATITYTLATSCIATKDVTVVPSPSGITGTASVCQGLTTSLSNATTGGTWSSSNTAVATVGSTGIVTGVSSGTTTINYNLGAGCNAVLIVTVNPTPGTISGTARVCEGSTTTLTDGGGGTWGSSNTALATVGSSTGVVTGVSSGTPDITYTLPTGCFRTITVTVNPLPSSISGVATVCVGSTTTLSDAGGGTWTSSNTTLATVGFTTGIVTGVSSGTPGITYTLPTGCKTAILVTVNPLPGAVTGTPRVCVGATTTLSAAGGGTWSSSNTALATAGSSTGVISGVSAGTLTITYTLLTGCFKTTLVTVNPLPSVITGTPQVCVGSITNLSSSGGGTWSSSNTSLATVNGSGNVTGVSSGTPTITHTLSTGCFRTIPVTVNPLPAAITGTNHVCVGSATTLSDGGGGTWSSSNTARATVDVTTGVVTGVAAGALTITYMLPTGCFKTMPFTVNPLPLPVSGVGSMCIGATRTLTDGASGGTWSSGNTGVATVVLTTGLVRGVSAGTSTITYTLSTGCIATAIVTVTPSPVAIVGPSSVCRGASITLTDAIGGGIWSSTSPFVTVGSATGVVNGVAPGAATVNYTIGSCTVSKALTVYPLSAITGAGAVCAGSTMNLNDATGGGAWSSSNTSMATVYAIGFGVGLVTGVSAGTPTITYTMPGTGCAATTTVTINPLPSAITGTATVCTGQTTTLSSAGGGTWSSSATGIATVGSSGTVTGVSAGTAIITYTLPTGCKTTRIVTVNTSPLPITGGGAVCVGSSIALSDATTGGTWSSSNTTIATVSGTGVVWGVSTGTINIYYTIGGICAVAKAVIVTPTPTPITGPSNVCVTSSILLTDGVSGGIWKSTSSTVSVDSSTGIVTGVSAGPATITYSIGSCATTTTITVDLLSPITGAGAVCIGSVLTLHDVTGGGTWSSTDPSVADVIAVGFGVANVTGVSAGVATIIYELGAGCMAIATVSVNPLASAITGTASVCVGQTTALDNATLGGTWSTSATGIATVDAFGVVTGVSAGIATITYTMGAGCYAVLPVTVNPLPAAISGSTTVCTGSTITLTDASTGGSWSSSDLAIATIDGTGIVSGVSPGSATITYTLGTGCFVTLSITDADPPTGISGPAEVCAGSTINLTDGTLGGTWSSSATSTATVDAGGVVTGVAPGTANIYYSMGTGCAAAVTVTVDALPAAIIGPIAVCTGNTITLSDVTTGGSWSSSATGIATVDGIGVVTGVAAGTATITYALSTGCFVIASVTDNDMPAAISGPSQVCTGNTITLTDVTLGGTWSSSATGIAIVGSTGVVSGLSAGTANIYYSLGTGCAVGTTITVDPSPAAITGSISVCTGNTIALSDATTGGSWSSSATGIATVDAFGVVTGVSSGSAIITYALSTGCFDTSVITDNDVPASISGPSTVCAGGTINLTDATSGGSWSSSATSIATVDTSGLVTGVAPGTANIYYVLGTGCGVAQTITVNPIPAAITGSIAVCVGNTIALADVTNGGSWSSSASGIASVDAFGVVTGVSAGPATITYTLGTGCFVTLSITVNDVPAAITGASTVCVGSTITLTDATTGGSWSSSATGIANVGSGGVVTGVSSGTANIYYVLSTGCAAAKTITVNSLPATIAGSSGVCVGSTITLTDAVTGGSWSSSATGVATVDGTGVVYGVSSGSATITYTLGTGCFVMKLITVSNLPGPIGGPSTVCALSTITLTDTVSGGSWSSSNTAVASINPTTGVVIGMSPGTANIYYMLGTGCAVAKTITVNPAPLPISGPGGICLGTTVALTDSGGGTWSSSNTSVATIDVSSGMVSALSTGVATITYTLPSGCFVTKTVTVSLTASVIGGPSSVCRGATITLTNAAAGGIWSSTSSFVSVGSTTGIVYGVTAGAATITYSIGTCTATKTITVYPISPITGASGVCVGSTLTLNDATGGGAWTSSDVSQATVTAVGFGVGSLTALSAGTPTITYTIVASGCAVTTVVTVNPLPSSISGTATVCAGQTTTLSDGGGGTWSSSNVSIATIGSVTGVVGGVSGGTAMMTYTLPTGCRVFRVVTVNPSPAAIGGASSVCSGLTITLTDGVTGGTWSSSGTSVATVSASGVVTGVSAGVVNIYYSLAGGCAVAKTITVNPSPTTITGPTSVCTGLTITLVNGVSGGIWSSTSSMVSVGSASGVITGVSPGAPVIMYSLGSCTTTKTITVNLSPNPITGSSGICVGSSISLSSGTTGGSWTSSATGIASVTAVGAGVGSAYGVSAGSATISYTLTNGCRVTKPVTVNACGRPLSSVQVVCVGSEINLTQATPGGIWTINDNTIAKIDPATGMLTGKSAGTTAAVYTVTTSLGTSKVTVPVVVYPAPDAVTISADPGTNITKGQNVALTANTSNGDFTYQWLVNGQPISSATASVFSGSSFADNDVVSCEVTGICGKQLSSNSVVFTLVNKGIWASAADVRLLPNPNKGIFTLKGSLGSAADEEVFTEVTDMLGQVVYKGTIVAKNGNIDQQMQLSGALANGMYILNLRSQQGNLVFHFVIEQ